jgi:hypothetical protein
VAIKFDLNTPLLSSVTADNLVSATLSLFCMNDVVGTEKATIYKISKDWKADEATWLFAKSGEMWQPGKDSSFQGGGDTTSKISSTSYAAAQAWENYDITPTVKEFLGGAANNGFLIVGDDRNGWTNMTPRLYASSELTGQTQNRPKITIKTTDTKIKTVNQTGLSGDISYTLTNSYLNLTTSFNNCQVSVSNLKGQTLLSIKGIGSTHKIPLAALSKGIHLITIIQNNRSETFRIIVNK